LPRRIFYRPSDRRAVDAELLKPFVELKLFSVNDVFGGWQKRAEDALCDKGVFDQIYAANDGIPTQKPSVLPGFGLTMAFTLLYLSLVVLIPLAGCCCKPRRWLVAVRRRGHGAAGPGFLSFELGSFAGRSDGEAVFGFLVAWVLVRYTFPGKKLIDAIVDLPFALPTARVGNRTQRALCPRRLDRSTASPQRGESYSYWGVVIVLTFIGLPFVVRNRAAGAGGPRPQVEEAAASLGAGRLQPSSA